MLRLTGVLAGGLLLSACARDPLPAYDASIGDGTMNGGGNTGMSSGASGSGSSSGGTGSSSSSGGSSTGASTGSGGTSTGSSSGTSSGATTGEEDASMPCPDRDADTVCDATDNCPDKANTDQKDADGDKAGDACDAPCVADPIAATISTQRATLSNIKVNGMAQVIDVMHDAPFTVSLDYNLSACLPGEFTLFHQLMLGFEGASSTPSCMFSSVCAPLMGSDQLQLTAPSTPGTYYVLYDVAQERSCSTQWPAGQPASTNRIAAICVR